MCPASCVGKAHRCYPILTTHAQIQSQHPLGSGRSNGVLGWREEPIAVVRLTEGGFLGQWPQVPLYKRSSAMCSWMLCSLTQESVQRWCIQGRRKNHRTGDPSASGQDQEQQAIEEHCLLPLGRKGQYNLSCSASVLQSTHGK